MTTTKRNIFLALAAAAAFGAPPTLAQQAPPARDPMTFAAFDLDANGIVTESEFTAARAQRQAARAADGAPMQGAASAPAFSEFDQNGDGQLTAEEFTAVQQARMQGRPRGPLPAPAGESPGAGATMGPGRGPGMGRDMPNFAEFDADGDGALTEQEFHDARARRIQERAEQGYPMRNLANAQTFEQITWTVTVASRTRSSARRRRSINRSARARPDSRSAVSCRAIRAYHDRWHGLPDGAANLIGQNLRWRG